MRTLALFALAAASSSGVAAADVLPYSGASVLLRDCSDLACGNLVAADVQFGYDLNASASTSIDGASGFAEASPGISDDYELPLLRTVSTVTVDGKTSTAISYAFQGYRNISDSTLSLAFAATVDWTGVGGYGFVLPTLAVLTDAVRDPEIGARWLDFTNVGAFTADCSTGGAIAVVNNNPFAARGVQSVTLDTASGTCGGGNTFSIASGQEFYVLARMVSFQYGVGQTDASHTFTTNLSPFVTPETQALLSTSLIPIGLASVPEPATWTLMILGFGAVGGAMRRRQLIAAKVRFA